MIIEGIIGRRKVGDLHPPALVGIVNISPESFYSPSIKTRSEEIEKTILKHDSEGASIVDIGAMSTRPISLYGGKPVTRNDEFERVKAIMPILKDLMSTLDLDFSIDTMHSEVAELALNNGFNVVNDVSGLTKDPNLARIVAEYDASLVVMASWKSPGDVKNHVDAILALSRSVEKALDAGVDEKKILVDPGIGGWGGRPIDVDLSIFQNLEEFRALFKPIYIGISQKSTIQRITGVESIEKRLHGSLAATALSVYLGAHVIRTHHVWETSEAVKIADAFKKKRVPLQEDSITLTPILRTSTPMLVKKMLERIDVEPKGTSILSEKAEFHVMHLRGVSAPEARILKQEFLSVGGDVATRKGL